MIEEEYIAIIDKTNRIVGKATKSFVHTAGKRHRVSAVLLKGTNGSYLIPTASRKKVEAGRLYHSAAGHVAAGESYKDAALRELKEETGIVADKVTPLGSFWFEKDYPSRIERERFEVYIVNYDGRTPIKLNKEQVTERWLTKDELLTIWHEEPEKVSGPLKMTCKLLSR